MHEKLHGDAYCGLILLFSRLQCAKSCMGRRTVNLFETSKLRNVALLAHSGSGKTSIVEAIHFASGAINRLGKTEDGTTVSDFEPEEHKHHTSLQLSVVPSIFDGYKINTVDTPGYADFIGETLSALSSVDSAIVVVSAPSGVEVGTEIAWHHLQKRKIPTLIFINKMDRENADFEGSVKQIQSILGPQCVPISLPNGTEAAFSETHSVLNKNNPQGLSAAIAAARDELVEKIAETDDGLTEKYLDQGDLDDSEIAEGLSVGVKSGQIAPILAGSSITGVGIQDLMKAIVDYLPSPSDAGLIAEDPAAAFIFKTSADPFVGKISYFRVVQGTMTPNTDLWDSNKNQSERIGQIFAPVGKIQNSVTSLAVGDIGAVTKLAHAVTGDTLTAKTHSFEGPVIEFPAPVYSVAVHPKTQADLEKMSTALNRLSEEDPSLRLKRDSETGELIATGLGDTHVDVLVERAKRKFGVDLELRVPQIPYRETISKITTSEYRHKKQSGGHGQYGHVLIRLEPLETGSGFQFGTEVVGGNVPKEYIPAVEKGVQKAMNEGTDGFPVVDLKVVLYDGSSHSVDSSGASFEIAGTMALKQGVRDALPVLLEPIMQVKINAPEASAGAVVGDLNTRRARINGMASQDGLAHIDAEVPRSEVQQWSTSLRALTQGRGSLAIEFGRFGEVPTHVQQKIVAEKSK